jgi:hypothetical protein
VPFRIVISDVWHYHIFPHYLINGNTFGKKKLLNTERVLNFAANSSEKFLILRRIQRDTNINVVVHTSSCKVPVILVRFLWNLYFLHRFSKHTHISIFMKIRPVGDVPRRRMDRQRDKQPLFAILRTRLKTDDEIRI